MKELYKNKYLQIDLVPYFGIGIGLQKTDKGREFLLFIPFITLQLTIKNLIPCQKTKE